MPALLDALLFYLAISFPKNECSYLSMTLATFLTRQGKGVCLIKLWFKSQIRVVGIAYGSILDLNGRHFALDALLLCFLPTESARLSNHVFINESLFKRGVNSRRDTATKCKIEWIQLREGIR